MKIVPSIFISKEYAMTVTVFAAGYPSLNDADRATASPAAAGFSIRNKTLKIRELNNCRRITCDVDKMGNRLTACGFPAV